MNPYNALLYNEVRQAGATVVEFGPRSLIGPSPDVLHIHWPEWLFSAPGAARAKSQAAAFRAVIRMLRNRGTRVVWTAHNLQAHAVHQPEPERQMWQWFTANIDGWISLSRSAVAQFTDRYPMLSRVPHVVIPHGHYRGVYPNSGTRSLARDVLGIPKRARVIGFVGRIQPYKQIPQLARTFSQLAGSDLRLLIAGKARDGEHTAIREVEDDRILFRHGFVPNARMQQYHQAVDLMVLPYSELQNSGSAILALSFDVPILVPDLGAMAELRDLVGAGWVQTYEGDLTPDVLATALEDTPSSSRAEISGLDWTHLGRQTVEFYNEVLTRKRS